MTILERRAIWRHNSFFGHCRMMEAQLKIMYRAETTTQETKTAAIEMLAKLQHLSRSLKTRA